MQVLVQISVEQSCVHFGARKRCARKHVRRASFLCMSTCTCQVYETWI